MWCSFAQSVESYLKIPKCPHCYKRFSKSVLDEFPQLVADEWDYKHNEIAPESCDVNSELLIWWKPKYGKPFKASANERTKINKGTSFAEQSIFYYIKQAFPDAINRYILKETYTEIDIYIPSAMIAIEYDGVFWHSEKADNDEQKNKVLEHRKIYLIRVRETGLTALSNNYGDTITICTKNTPIGLHLHEVINQIFVLIRDFLLENGLIIDGCNQKMLDSFCLTKDVLIDDRPSIYAQYITAYQQHNIGKTCLIKYWDFEKNKNLYPSNVKYNANIFIAFTCPSGYKFQTKPKYLKLKDKVDCKKGKNKCQACYISVCPFYIDFHCPNQHDCEYSKQIEQMHLIPEKNIKWNGYCATQSQNNNGINAKDNDIVQMRENYNVSIDGLINQSNHPIDDYQNKNSDIVPIVKSGSISQPSACETADTYVGVEKRMEPNNIKPEADNRKQSKSGLQVLKSIFNALLSVLQVIVIILALIFTFFVALFFGESIKIKRRSNAAKKGWKTRKLNDKFIVRKRRSPINGNKK